MNHGGGRAAEVHPEESGAWFDALTAALDATERPYVLLMLDVKTVAGELRAPGEVSTLWRSTLSREAAIDGLRQLADLLESKPELLEGAES